VICTVACNNPLLSEDDVLQLLIRLARIQTSASGDVTDESGVTITVPCRAKLQPNGQASIVDVNGNPTLAAERCADTDPNDFCQEIPNCFEEIDARTGLAIAGAFAIPLSCENLVWEGQSTSLVEAVPGSSGKGMTPRLTQPNPTVVALLGNASAGPTPRVPLLATHCPNIATAIVEGQGTAEDGSVPGEGCGRRFVRAGSSPKSSSSAKSGALVETYVCDYVDLTVGCTGNHANPRRSEMIQACFEVCEALGPALCNGYSLDLNPVDLTNPNVGTRDLFGRCLLFDRPLQDLTNYDFTSTVASSTSPSPKGKGMSMGMSMGSPAPTLKLYPQCQMVSSVVDVDALPPYDAQEDFCTDPIVLLELDLQSSPGKSAPPRTYSYRSPCTAALHSRSVQPPVFRASW
jgi:hypothetical protein